MYLRRFCKLLASKPVESKLCGVFCLLAVSFSVLSRVWKLVKFPCGCLAVAVLQFAARSVKWKYQLFLCYLLFLTESCPSDDEIVQRSRKNPKCQPRKTRFCYKRNCRRQVFTTNLPEQTNKQTNKQKQNDGIKTDWKRKKRKERK